MELTLPTKVNVTHPIMLDTKILVVIGANGAGKSSFGRDLLERYAGQAKRISGIHALFISDDESKLSASNEFARLQSMIKERLFMPRISEYEKLILQLQSEEFEAAVNFKEACKTNNEVDPPITKIDIIQAIWEKMFPHNRLIRKSGFIELVSTGRDSNSYTAGRMSDSEKLVFYLIGAALCACPNALLVIEEPETLLHNSIKNQLWDEIEAIRPDCTFVYLTHDIDFATSRSDSKRIWIRSYDADHSVWDYELIESNESFPEEVYMEILGSRKPILFIEGTDTNSIDSKLYPFIFPDYLVKPMGGCQKVIETTKAFGQLKDFHTLDSKGIVDCLPVAGAHCRHCNVFFAAVIGGIADQTVSGLIGVTSFSGFDGDASNFCTVHSAEHIALQQDSLRMLVSCGCGILIGAQDLTAGIVFHDITHKQGDICGSAVVFLVL